MGCYFTNFGSPDSCIAPGTTYLVLIVGSAIVIITLGVMIIHQRRPDSNINQLFSSMPSATQTLTSVGIVLVLSAFFFVNLVPGVPLQVVSCNHGTGICTQSVVTVSSFAARQLSFFGFNTPGLPAWAFTTSDAILIIALISFSLDAYFTIKDHL